MRLPSQRYCCCDFTRVHGPHAGLASRATSIVLAGIPEPDLDMVTDALNAWNFCLTQQDPADIPLDVQACIISALPRLEALESREGRSDFTSMGRQQLLDFVVSMPVSPWAPVISRRSAHLLALGIHLVCDAGGWAAQ